MKCSDAIALYVKELDIPVFSVVGGGAMHLNDSFHHIGCQVIYCQHEQACAMAAEGYARVTNKPAVVCVTSGPGSMNALTGVWGAWVDSIPMVVISGQVKKSTCKLFQEWGGRQLGDQEVDIIHYASNCCKTAVTLSKGQYAFARVKHGYHASRTGRMGPVWIDIPVDVQAEEIHDQPMHHNEEPFRKRPNTAQLRDVLDALSNAKRPILLLGTGVRLAGAVDIAATLVDKLRMPVMTAWCHDVVDNISQYYCGRPSSIGQRAPNMLVHDCDLLLIIGSRIGIRQTGYNWDDVAPNATIIQVDIDEYELDKPTFRATMPIMADAYAFIDDFTKYIKPISLPDWSEWLDSCHAMLRKYPREGTIIGYDIPTVIPDPYQWVHELSKYIRDDDIIVCGIGTAVIATFQTLNLRSKQRMWSTSGGASMGYGLPAAIGAAVAAPDRRVICIEGDGSMQMNIQELATLKRYNLNVKVFVLDNNGYSSIKQTQDNFFGRRSGCDFESGLPYSIDYKNIASAYGIESYTRDFNAVISNKEGPSVTQVKIDDSKGFVPRVKSRTLEDGTIVSPSLNDMYPFL